jgi:hypothetical protein
VDRAEGNMCGPVIARVYRSAVVEDLITHKRNRSELGRSRGGRIAICVPTAIRLSPNGFPPQRGPLRNSVSSVLGFSGSVSVYARRRGESINSRESTCLFSMW